MKPATKSKAIDEYSDQISAADRLVILRGTSRAADARLATESDDTIRDLIDSVETLAETLDETRERLADANRLADEHLQDLIKAEDDIADTAPLDVLLAVFALSAIERLWRLWTTPSAKRRKVKR